MKLKGLIYLVLMFFLVRNIYSQDLDFVKYDLAFTGRGESTEVDNVLVENLTQNTSMELTGTDTLRLTTLTTELEEVYISRIKTKLYPNPAYSESLLDFVTIKSDQVIIKVISITGRLLNSASFNLEPGEYRVTIPVPCSGINIVSIQGGGVCQSVKWLCVGKGSSGSIDLNYSGEAKAEIELTESVLKSSTSSYVKEMFFKEGDLLRFTGSSGNMKTIVMNQPTCDHDITFDFYDCTDASGNHYPIVNAGGLLWMAEDLKTVSSSKVSLRSSSTAWTDYPSGQPKAAYYVFTADNSGYGVYYNFAGAKAALPDEWQLPTAGQVDYMLNNLGGYDKAAQLLKSTTSGDWGTDVDGLDTISFDAAASGLLTTAGEFSGMDYKVNYWTRSTSSGVPLYWGIENDEMDFSSGNTSDAGNGYKVRGVRTAPSAYNNIIENLFSTSTSTESSDLKSTTSSSLFASGPLGSSYIISDEKKKVFTDIPTSGLIHYDYESDKYVKTLIEASTTSDYLRKTAAQNNSNGRQNLIVASWNRPLDLWNATKGIAGDGTVSLVIYGDSTQNYARQDSIVLDDDFTMDYIGSFTDAKGICHNSSFPSNIASMTASSELDSFYYADLSRLKNITFEDYSSRFNVLSADFNEDGIGDIVVVVDRKVVVYDGESHVILSSKTFSTYDDNNVRIAVGDINNDSKPDIAAVYICNSDYLMRVEAYPDGDLSYVSSITSNFTFTHVDDFRDFEDIKIGNVTGHDFNSIVAMASSTNEQPKICVFEYDSTSTGYLKNVASFEGDKLNRKCLTLNFNVTLAHSRGSVYPADIYACSNVLRYTDDEDGSNTGTLESLTKKLIARDDGWTKDYYIIHIDNVKSGNFDNNEEGIEQLAVLYSRNNITFASYTFKDVSLITPKIVQLNTNYTLVTSDLASGVQCMEVDYIGVFSNYYPNFIYNYCYLLTLTSVTSSTMQAPVIGAARGSEGARVLKYDSHTSSMSEPRIYALLASPPYYKYCADDTTAYEYEYDMGTSWGTSTESSSSTENCSSNAATVIFGYEQDFNIPILGTKVGGIDFTTSLSFEWTNSYTTDTVITKGNLFTAKNNDAVILMANFYDTYTYEIVKSGNSDEIGTYMEISIPSTSRTMMMTVDDYERLTEDNPDVPNLRKAFVHTVGYPFTYPSSTDDLKADNETSILWGGSVNGSEFIGAGSGGNRNCSISLNSSTSTSSSFSFDLDVELVVTAMGAKLGGGYGYNSTNTTSHTETTGHTIEGIVAGLRELGEGDLSDFTWNVCWYKKTIGGQTFPVVYYVVKK